jgi:O-antigen/teichoic acid export membrane protein
MSQEDAASLGYTTVSGTFWLYIAKYSGKFFVFISTAILARLLLQEEFGVAGYALVVIGFLEVLQGLGVGAALIYYKKSPELPDTAFWLGLGVGLLLFVVTWFLAPLVGLYFNDPRAIPVTRALGLTFPLNAFSDVHDALLYKDLAFRRRFLPELTRSVAKGATSISLALLGLGAWSLIWGQLGGVVVGAIVFWLVIPWQPSLRFDRRLARDLLAYGTRLSASDVVSVFLANADYLLVGRYLGAAALGVYTLAFRVPELLIKEFSGVVGKVVFPIYARMRDDQAALRQGFLLTMRYVNLLTVPMGLGLALVARPFVLTVFSDRWAEAAPVMSAIALYTLLRALVFNTGDVYKAQGRPGLLAQIKIGQLLVSLPALWWVTAELGTLVGVAWTQVVLVFLAAIVKLAVAVRILDVPAREVFDALRPSLASGAVLALIVWGGLQLTAGLAPPLQLGIAIVSGVASYGAMLWLLEREMVLQVVARLTQWRKQAIAQANQGA